MYFFIRLCALLALFLCSFLPSGLAAGPAAGTLSVLQTLPEGKVERLTQIVIRFSEAMRPLGVAEETAQSAPARIEALEGTLPPGSWLWLDPSTLAYQIAGPVDEPVRLRVVIPKGVTALSGATLAAETRFTVANPALAVTAAPRVDHTMSGVQALPPQGGSIILESNYRLDPQSLRPSLVSETGPVALGPVTEPEWQKTAEDLPFFSRWTYTVPVTGAVPPSAKLSFRLAPGFTTAGGVDLRRSFIASIPTYEALSATLSPDASAQGETVHPAFTLSVRFNNPVRSGEVMRHLSIEPATESAREPAREEDAASPYFSLPCKLTPGTAYTVTLRKGLTDEYGTALAHSISRTYVAGDYTPGFSMDTGELLLEKARGANVVLKSMNIGEVAVRLFFIPWDKGGYAAYGPAGCEDATLKSLAALPGAIVKDIALNAPERNTYVTHSLDLAAELGLGSFPESAQPGFFVTAATFPAGKKQEPVSFCSRIQVTGIGLTMKRGHSNSLAFVTGLESGKPLPGAALALRDGTGAVLWQGTSDDNGLAFAPGLATLPAKTGLYLAASKDGDHAVLPVREKDGSWNQTDIHTPDTGAPDEGAEGEALAAHALTQLPLYEPGQEVNYVLFIRRHHFDDTADTALRDVWLPESGRDVTVEVRDSRNKSARIFSAQSNAYGSVAGTLRLPDDATPGTYSIRVRPGRNEAGQDDPWLAAGSFTVASFRPPEFKVDVTAPDSQVLAEGMKRELAARVDAGYFSGAPLPGGGLSLTVRPSDSSFKPERLAGYTSGLGEAWPFFRHPRDRAPEAPQPLAANLDKDGTATVALPPLAAEPGLPLDVELEATVTDGSGLASQGTASFTLHPADSYIGIKGPRFASAKVPFALDLKAASVANAALTDVSVTLRAERRLPANDGEERFEPVWSRELTLARAEGERFSVTLEEGGLYRLYAEIEDEAGRRNLSRLTVYVPGTGVAWFGPADAGGLELAADEDRYAPGDVARIVIKNPYERATALVTTERDGIRAARVLEVHGPAPELEISLFDDDAPYVYVGVTLVHGRIAKGRITNGLSGQIPQEPDMEEDEDTGRPGVSHAVLRLQVHKESPELGVAVTTDADNYRPGDSATATVRTTLRRPDGDSAPQKAQITLLAVDERILRAAGENTNYDPSPSFSPQSPHRVATCDLRTLLGGLSRFYNRHYTNRIRTASGAMLMAPDAAPPEQDSGFMARQRVRTDDTPVREDFGPLAFWLADGETDGEGQLTASFTLPDTLTSYRIVAVAADTDGRFATAEHSVTASKPLQVLPALPGFVVEGDSLAARFLVQNFGKSDGDAVVELRVTGADADVERLTVPVRAGGDAVASFTVRPHAPDSGGGNSAPGGSGRLSLTVTATLGEERDAAAFTLPVLPARPLDTVAASGMLKAGESFTLPVSLPRNLDPRSSLDVILAASPAAGLAPAVGQLMEYPYECLEQRFSKAWGRALRLEHGKRLGLTPEQNDRERIAATLKSAASFQNPDGGFTLWPGFVEYETWSLGYKSNLYLSAYVLLAADHMRALGFALDPEVESNAYNYLAESLDRRFDADAEGEEAFSGSGLETEGMALWALSRNAAYREKTTALFDRLYDRALAVRQNAAPLLWSSLILALDRLPDAGDRDKRLERLVRELETRAQVTPTQLHFTSQAYASHWMTMGSPLRDNGIILAALSLARPEYPRLDALAFWLGQGLGEKETLSTQEAVFGFWGLAVYLERLGSDGATAVKAVWNGKDRIQAAFAGPTDPPSLWTTAVTGGQGELAFEATEGAPCWTARLRYAPRNVPAEAKNAGFTLKREIGATAWRMGDEVAVTLTLYVPATRRHVLLFDPLPAGLEPLYASRVDLGRRTLTNQAPWQYQDMLKDGLMLYAPVVQPGVYTYTYHLRAAFPGAFIHRPGRVEEMYTPEVYGRSATGRIAVDER